MGSTNEVSDLDHVTHFLVEAEIFKLEVLENLLEAQFVVDGLLRTEVRVGNQVVTRFNKK